MMGVKPSPAADPIKNNAGSSHAQAQQKNVREGNFYFLKYRNLSYESSMDTNWEITEDWEDNVIYHLSGLIKTL